MYCRDETTNPVLTRQRDSASARSKYIRDLLLYYIIIYNMAHIILLSFFFFLLLLLFTRVCVLAILCSWRYLEATRRWGNVLAFRSASARLGKRGATLRFVSGDVLNFETWRNTRTGKDRTHKPNYTCGRKSGKKQQQQQSSRFL